MRRANQITFFRFISVLTVLVVWTGCATYTAAPKRYSEWNSRVEMDLPGDWLQFTKADDGFTITKDGLRLETIKVRTRRVGDKIEGSERVYAAGMLPHEAAELTVGLAKADPDLANFEVEAIGAIELAGRDGYRIDATYVDDGGLRKRTRIYGAVFDKQVCELIYEGADQVYFDKYEGDFEKVVASVTVR